MPCARSSRCRPTGSTSQGSCWRRTRGACARRSSATDARSTKTRPCTSSKHAFDPTPVLTPAAAYLGARPEEIALTDSTTMGLAMLYSGLPLRNADDVLTTTHDHYATHESLRLARCAPAQRCARWRCTSARRGQRRSMAQRDRAAIPPKTRVVAITWVHSSTGVKTPVRAIADVVASANAARAPEQRILLCVDGVHGFGIEDVTMADLGCDFFVAGHAQVDVRAARHRRRLGQAPSSGPGSARRSRISGMPRTRPG